MTARTGLPTADSRRVVRFIGGLLSHQRPLVVAVVLANGLAATAGLLVPRLLGTLVDSTVADVEAGRVDAALAGANTAALVVAGARILQKPFPLPAQKRPAGVGPNRPPRARGVLLGARPPPPPARGR